MKKQNFTLVELLTVIAIIGILAGILLPALGMVKENAKHNQALTEAKTISMAIKSFYNDYKYLPWKPSSSMDVVICGDAAAGDAVSTNAAAADEGTLSEDYLKFFDILCCSDLVTGGTSATSPSSNSTAFNPQKKKFLNPPNSYFSSEVKTKGFRDPWGRSYIIYLDTNYDQKIGPSSGSTDYLNKLTGNSTIPDTVAVLSFGKSGVNNVNSVTSTNRIELATSWQ